MATHVSQDGGAEGRSFPAGVPFDVEGSSRLSWELGSRVVDDDESTLLEEWEHTGSSRTLSRYRVTTNTDVVCVRTPAGRERFYGVARMDFEDARSRLEDAPYWRRVE